MLRSREHLAGMLAMVALAAIAVLAQAPSWWMNRGVLRTGAGVVTNDFSPVNQGQVKWLATQAVAEFNEKLQFIGGAGTQAMALVASFSPTNNYRPVNAGQLKNTVAPFYLRLFELDLTNCYPQGAGRPYPWSGSTNPARDFSIVNAGQTKYVFSFNTEVDSDGDGIPDIWEVNLGSNPYVSDANAMNTNAWAQGLTNLELYQGMFGLTIPNAWAVYTNTTQVAVVADIRSRNRYLTVKAAEFFLDSTNGVTFGAGTALSAVDGAFNSTNEMAQAIFTPTFSAGERHEIFIHAQGNDNRWCPFVKAILNPNINDILDRIQANYSAFTDLQYDVVITGKDNGVIVSTGSASVKMKGPYKVRSEDANGLVSIRNENQYCWYHSTQGFGDMFEVGINGDFLPANNHSADYFWEIPLTRIRSDVSVSNAVSSTLFDILLISKPGVRGFADHSTVDFAKGFVRQVSTTVDGVLSKSEFPNPVEVLTGKWMFSVNRQTVKLANGDEFITEIMATNIRANQGLADSLFAIPIP